VGGHEELPESSQIDTWCCSTYGIRFNYPITAAATDTFGQDSWVTQNRVDLRAALPQRPTNDRSCR